MKLFVLAFVPFVFLACSSKKEKTEVKSPLEYLSGETYGVKGETPVGQGTGAWNGPEAIPVTGVKNKVTRVRGTLMLGDGIAATPLKFTLVRLVDESGKTVAEVSSDIGGQFVLSGVFPNGHYVAELVSAKYRGSAKIYVNSYNMEVSIHAEKR
ncbi:MAG: hypothetical protein J7501_15230 [Bdellovibrio sp.]|nr:hypothetical protein [Bdellovibrio sp.]